MSQTQTSNRIPQNLAYHVVFAGNAVCLPDGWGNVFPVPESHVILHTTDRSYAKANPTFGSKIAYDNTQKDGSFAIVSTNHPPYLKNKDLYLEVINRATKETYYPLVTPIGLKAKPQSQRNTATYDVGLIRTSWRANPPVIGSFNGRKFQYPAEFANVLAADAGPVRGPASLELVLAMGGQPEYGDLLRMLERESNSQSTSITSKLAKELIPVLGLSLEKVRRARDVFRMALEQFSKTQFNLIRIDDLKAAELGIAVRKAFGGRGAYFVGFEGRVGFCALMYAAGAIESGLKTRTTFGTTGSGQVINLVVS